LAETLEGYAQAREKVGASFFSSESFISAMRTGRFFMNSWHISRKNAPVVVEGAAAAPFSSTEAPALLR